MSYLAVDVETPVRAGLTTVATFIPRLLGFLVILVVGYFVAKLIAKVVDKALEKAGFDRAVERGGIKKALAKSSFDASDIVAKLVFFAVFIPVLSMAFGVLGIATTVTTPLLYTVFAAVAGVIIVGVGGGLIQPMQNRWENLLNKADQEKDKVQAHLRAQAAAAPGETAYPVDAATTTRLTPPLPRP